MAHGTVIVGTGQGGFQLAASLRDSDYADPITLVGDEPDPARLDPDLAHDGVEEYFDAFVDTAFATGAAPEIEATLVVELTDRGDAVRRDLPHPGPVTTLRGTAGEMLLALWHRRELLAHFVDGDRAIVEGWPRI